MKKFLTILIALLLVICCTACDGDVELNKKLERDRDGKGYINGSYVEIYSYGVGYDDYGNLLLAVKYLYTPETSCDFDGDIIDVAFQNGIRLDKVYADEVAYKTVQGGHTVEIVMEYALEDTSDVDIELYAVYVGCDDKVVGTIEIEKYLEE